MIMMDGMVFVRGSASRSTSASAAERSLLLGALATHMGVLDTRENDAQTVLRKSELWDEITRHFNSNTSTPRSRQQIQTLYKNMKAKARRYEARLAEVASGIPPPDPDPISEMLLGLLHQQLRHQQRHLRNLVARDTNGGPADSDQTDGVLPFKSHFINPEQMMQVSLSEGTAEDIDIKSEFDEDDLSTTEDSVSNAILLQPFPETPINTSDLKTIPSSPQDSSDIKNSPTLVPSVSSPTARTPPACVESSAKKPQPLNTVNSTMVTGQNNSEDATSFSCPPSPKGQTHFQYGMTDQSPLATSNCYISHPVTNPKNSFAALKSFISSEEKSFQKTSDDLRPDSVTPPPKRNRVEYTPMSCHGTATRNLGCCCPEIHSRLLAMAQEEHHLKIGTLKKENELRNQEHAARMRILALEEEEARLRLTNMKIPLANHTEDPVINNSTCEPSQNN